MNERTYSSTDIRLAEELGGVKAYLKKIDETLTKHVIYEEETKKAMWARIDANKEKLSEHSGFIKWIIGIGVGLQIGVFVLMEWLRLK